MEMGTLKVVSRLLLLSACVLHAASEQCAMFTADNWYSNNVEESYLEVGNFDFGMQASISMDVLPDMENYNGVLFAMGTENFTYNPQWLIQHEFAKAMQFVVVEIFYGAASLKVKMANSLHPVQLEVFRTYPDVYHLDDGRWHHIEVTRDDHNYHITVDNQFTASHGAMTNDTHNTLITNRPGYIGGRPDYYSWQFRGVIKNLVVHEQRVRFSQDGQHGLSDVKSCTSRAVRRFIEEIRAEPWATGSSYQGGNQGGGGDLWSSVDDDEFDWSDWTI